MLKTSLRPLELKKNQDLTLIRNGNLNFQFSHKMLSEYFKFSCGRLNQLLLFICGSLRSLDFSVYNRQPICGDDNKPPRAGRRENQKKIVMLLKYCGILVRGI